ncbi:MAG: helix-turn-helix transcriptional regulator [Pseudomonadota bacterium]
MTISENQLATRLKAIGERLRALRLQQNLSQQALAERVGVSLKTVSNAEDQGRISLETLLRLLDGLGQLDRVDSWLAADEVSPIALLERKGRPRQRAHSRKSAADWEW